MIYRLKQAFTLGVLLVMMGCSSTGDRASADNHSISDPIEGLNRKSWSLNYDVLDPYVLRPISLAYVNYTPSPIRTAIANVFSNLDEPSSMINNLLMGNGRIAVDHFNRFWMNSTFGLFGLIDIASAAGIPKHDAKGFGDAIGHYGVGNGPYLMIPAVGPYSPRQVTDAVDTTYLPLSYLNIWASVGKFVFQGMETRAALVNQEPMLNNSPDPYAVVKDAYKQRQDFKAEIQSDNSYNSDEEEMYDEYLDDYSDE